MRSSNLFWGGALMLLGGLFLIDSLGIISINLWRVFWPLLLILFGVWMLFGYFMQGRMGDVEGEAGSIPLGDATQAKIHVHHGAGKLTVDPGVDPLDMVTGTFNGGLDYASRQDGESVRVTMRVRDRGFPVVMFPWAWGPQNALDWHVHLTDEIPLDLRFNTGASDTRLNLTDLRVASLRVETGASATVIQMPDNMDYTKAVVKAGASSIKIHIPEEVAAKIRVTGGMMGASVDRQRFPKSGGYYQSPDYDSVSHKAEIRVEMGAGSVTVQ